jgi:hypothetical protein
VGIGLKVHPMMDCLIRPFLILNLGFAAPIVAWAWAAFGAVNKVPATAVVAADLRIVLRFVFIISRR